MYAARVLTPRGAMWMAVGLAAVLLAGSPAAAQNVLLNPGFETDAATGQDPVPFATDWQLVNTGEKNTVSAPNHPVRTGVGSLQLIGLAGFGVPLGFQAFPAEPGQTWDLQGYIRTEAALTEDTRALLKIVFRDTTQAMDLEPASITIGTADAQPFPGIISAPQLTSAVASPTGEWVFAQAQGVAPPGTSEVSFFAILVDDTASTVYFDDLQAGLVTATLPGDFNSDSKVDSVDLGLWSAAFATTDVGDADDDGDSDGNDFLIWQRNVTASPASAVPEPAAFVVAATGLALAAGASRRRDG